MKKKIKYTLSRGTNGNFFIKEKGKYIAGFVNEDDATRLLSEKLNQYNRTTDDKKTDACICCGYELGVLTGKPKPHISIDEHKIAIGKEVAKAYQKGIDDTTQMLRDGLSKI